MLVVDPTKRISAREILLHPWMNPSLTGMSDAPETDHVKSLRDKYVISIIFYLLSH